MASVTRDVLVAASPEKLFDVIAHYDAYADFVPGLKACRVKSRGPTGVDVEYELDLGLKTIRYVLRHQEERPTKMTWSLVSGDWMKVSSGGWDLAPEGGGTRARYTVDIQIAKPPLIPQSVVDRVADELTRVQLPKTLDAFKARAEQGA
jgi:coenzyme Q-binding protein COQ10